MFSIKIKKNEPRPSTPSKNLTIKKTTKEQKKMKKQIDALIKVLSNPITYSNTNKKGK